MIDCVRLILTVLASTILSREQCESDAEFHPCVDDKAGAIGEGEESARPRVGIALICV